MNAVREQGMKQKQQGLHRMKVHNMRLIVKGRLKSGIKTTEVCL